MWNVNEHVSINASRFIEFYGTFGLSVCMYVLSVCTCCTVRTF